jgi:hypothetical protein
MITRIPTEKEFRETLFHFFNSHGFRVDDVSDDDNEERADQLVSDQSVRVLLELKIKGEDETEVAERDSALNSSGIHRYAESSIRRNRMSALIGKGVSQLIHTPIVADFNVLCLHSAGRYADHHQLRFVATLYGRRWLIQVPGSDGRYCYYFDNSDFFRHRAALAAAIVSCGDECQLCINDLHPTAEKFRQSPFRALFSDGCIDPPELEARGDAYIAPANVTRGDEAAMLKGVAQKYNVARLLDFDPTLYMAEARVEDWQRVNQNPKS